MDVLCCELVVGKGLLGISQAFCIDTAGGGSRGCVTWVGRWRGVAPLGRGMEGSSWILSVPRPPAPAPEPPTTPFQVLPQVLPQVQPKLPKECRESPRHAPLPGGSARGVRFQQEGVGGEGCGPATLGKTPRQISAQPCALGPGTCWGWGSSLSAYAGCQGRLH